MKKIISVIIFISLSGAAMAQYTLDSCQVMARNNYPMIRQYELVDRLAEFSISNASKAYLPQITLSGSATYQSDVVSFPDNMEQMFQLAGVDFDGFRKDQYKVLLDISQNIWDGGVSKARKEEVSAEREVSEKNLDAELYSLKKRVNQVYFGILMLEENLKLNALVERTLESNYEVVRNCIANGVAMESELSQIKAELLANSQNRSKIAYAKDAYIKVLSVMTGAGMDGASVFARPEIPLLSDNGADVRPELALIDAQKASLAARKRSLDTGVMPKFSLFAQGFYGYPGLNMFEDMLRYNWSPNYIVGIRFQWNISAFYTKRNNTRQIETSSMQLDLQRDRFLYNNNIERVQNDADIRQMQDIMREDDEIIELRTFVRQTSESKFRNGTITVNDLLKDISNESKAILDKSLHELEYLESLYEKKNIIN